MFYFINSSAVAPTQGGSAVFVNFTNTFDLFVNSGLIYCLRIVLLFHRKNRARYEMELITRLSVYMNKIKLTTDLISSNYIYCLFN